MPRETRESKKMRTNRDNVKEALAALHIPDPEEAGELLPDPATHAATNGSPYQSLLKARDMQIWALRIRGYSASNIADHFDIHENQVNNAIARASASITGEVPQTVVKLELARLDYLLIKAMDVLETRHAAFSHGQVMYDPTTDRPFVDTAPTLQAIDRCLKIQERRARLLALDRDPTAPSDTNDILTPDLQAMINSVNTQAENFLKQATSQDNNNNNNTPTNDTTTP